MFQTLYKVIVPSAIPGILVGIILCWIILTK
jgi:ABC-type spermidine/putrescine transport system permease subunit I